MSRLVVVSNRVATPHHTQTGGLACAMASALEERGGLWFGWSGKCVADGQRTLHRQSYRSIDYALLDLTRSEYENYYLGFANRTLWPLLHFQPSMMDYRRACYAGYRAVNRLFAQRLAPLLRSDDQIWIHDYHLIPLAAELRKLGVSARIGFFLHTPVPPPEVLDCLPCHADLLPTLSACDLVGVQIEGDAQSLMRYFERMDGVTRVNDTVVSGGRRTRIAAFPISINTAEVARLSAAAGDNMANRRFFASLDGRKLAIGVDRLDYSKGLPQRFTAFGTFLDEHHEWRREVSLLQIAPPSREEVPEYQTLRRDLERIAGATNGRYAEPDWVPIRYMNRSFSQATLAGFFRVAQLGLVTPLRDGMNLVAKEFIAAQSPEDPGALVLSRFAGAADELREAILVDPGDPDGLAEAIAQGLEMPRTERRERWYAMFEYLSRHDIAAWRSNFLAALALEPREGAAPTQEPMAQLAVNGSVMRIRVPRGAALLHARTTPP